MQPSDGSDRRKPTLPVSIGPAQLAVTASEIAGSVLGALCFRTDPTL